MPVSENHNAAIDFPSPRWQNQTMKKSLCLLILSLSSIAHAAPATPAVSVDSSETGVVSITISGGKGSQAEKLYNSLTGDDAMGGYYGTDKQANAIDCGFEDDSHVKATYTCTIKVSTKGDSLSPAS
jgi:hypothetical protein